MKTFFCDEFINTKLMSRMVKKIKEEQLAKTIDELGYLNEIQSNVISRYDFMTRPNQKLEFIKKLNNAKR